MGWLHGERDRGCARAREWASLRLDGELSEVERLLLRRHLSRCEGCGAFVAGIEAATQAVRATPQALPSRALAPEPPPARPRVRLKLAAVAGLAALTAGVGAGVGLLVDSGGSSPSPTAPRIDIAEAPPEAPEPPPPTTTVTL